MKLLKGLLLPAVIGAASALPYANVYLFQGDEWPNTSNPPTLSPEQARLVFAQRLGTSKYHGLEDTDESTLSYINKFGGLQASIFQEWTDANVPELILIVEGVSSTTAEPLLNAWSSMAPAFTISEPPSMAANKELIADFNQQSGHKKECALENAINPYDSKCWNGKTKVVHFDLGDSKDSSKMDELIAAQERLIRFAKKQEMNVIVVLMPEASRSARTPPKPYGSYEKALDSPIYIRRGFEEEPITDSPNSFSPPAFSNKQVKAADASDNSTFEPITGVPPLCHASLNDCISATNNCSGHGECFQKYGNASNNAGSCFSCACTPTEETFKYNTDKEGIKIVYWGGAACQKRDISGPFWIIAIPSVIMVGLVAWAIGLLFSIGEEKLPGVIGAGVSSKSR